MAYPEEYGLDFEDFGGIRIVRIAGNLPVHAHKTYKTRHEWAVRKILVHHHAGHARDTNPKRAAGAFRGAPDACITTANFFVNPDDPAKQGTQGKNWPGYAYHYDIPYHDEIVDGLRVVYETQSPDRVGYHTGSGQNSMGIGVSLIGYMRTLEHPTGASFSPDDGRISDHQKAALPELVRWLQRKYLISDLHVQGHFQHGKPTCPGWDAEFWVMRRETSRRRQGNTTCWPLQIEDARAGLLLDTDADAELPRAKRYFANTLSGGSGHFPFARQFLWHDGVHLFPPGGRGESVFAVRDGWAIGARIDKSVVVDGTDYGSANFVLLLHEDPGLYDPLDSRSTFGGSKRPKPLEYYSLYMHLEPLDESIPWMQRLRDRAPDRFKQLTDDPTVARHFASIAVPVFAGELVGRVGRYAPFARRDADAPTASPRFLDESHESALHFETFARVNPLAIADPNRDLPGRWTIRDRDANSMAERVLTRLDAIDGFTDEEVEQLRRAGERADEEDPQYQDPTVWPTHLTPALADAMSKVTPEHLSEWRANWNVIIDRHYSRWGMDRAEANHLKRVVAEFQWWSELVRSERGWPSRDTGLSPNARPFYFHPVRFLCWCAGLERALDAEPSGGIDDAGFPASDNPDVDFHDWYRAVVTTDDADANEAQVRIGRTDPNRLTNGTIRFATSTTAYHIARHEPIGSAERPTGHTLTLAPPLGEDVPRGTRAKLGNYGWRWIAHFDWEESLA